MLRLLSVGSKRFLTNKVDRSVTGLIAQQQCVGPLHIPLADVAVIAQVYCCNWLCRQQTKFMILVQSHWSTKGIASAIGEQPIKGLIDPSAMVGTVPIYLTYQPFYIFID